MSEQGRIWRNLQKLEKTYRSTTPKYPRRKRRKKYSFAERVTKFFVIVFIFAVVYASIWYSTWQYNVCVSEVTDNFWYCVQHAIG